MSGFVIWILQGTAKVVLKIAGFVQFWNKFLEEVLLIIRGLRGEIGNCRVGAGKWC
jgi:hypothetical protein